ncbi:MAG: hypothetical protein RIQ78_1731 [Bacteroidota bacterium]|jgi:hypothetical protein
MLFTANRLQNYAFVNALPNQKATPTDKSRHNSRPLQKKLNRSYSRVVVIEVYAPNCSY